MTSELTLVSTTERADLDEQVPALFSEHWPEYIFHDPRVGQYMERKNKYFADWDFYALDPAGRLLGACYGVPLRWDRTLADLPEGYTDSLARSVLEHEAGTRPDTLVVMGAMVRKDEAGKGLAGQVLRALRGEAARRGLTAVIAPVRPTLKSSYPLADIDEFASWTRPDGLPLDPWLRTHVRLGATVLQGAPRSQTMTGTVDEWQSWTGLALPASGAYVIPDGLALLHVDREADHGVYHDPNVWMRHV
jgi:GNAT superfamily N-acetyltransferase